MQGYLFIGPTGSKIQSCLSETSLVVLPPAARGDVAQLVGKYEPSTIVLVDGIFETVPAVSHKELISAIHSGWEVVGLSSMGAIRAYELRSFGMKGFGRVYELLLSCHDLTDDEFAVHFFPAPPFSPISVALVDLRIALEDNKMYITPIQRDLVIADMKKMYFGNRDQETILQVMQKNGIDAVLSVEIAACIDRKGSKSTDVETFLCRQAGKRG